MISIKWFRYIWGVLVLLIIVTMMHDLKSYDLCMADMFRCIGNSAMYYMIGMVFYSCLICASMHFYLFPHVKMNFGSTVKWWDHAERLILKTAVFCALYTIVLLLIVGAIMTGGIWQCFSSRYSLCYVETGRHLPAACANTLVFRSCLGIFLVLVFNGLLASAGTLITGKGYIGVIISTAYTFFRMQDFALLPFVNSSYYYFIKPDHSLIYSLIIILILHIILKILFKWGRAV